MNTRFFQAAGAAICTLSVACSSSEPSDPVVESDDDEVADPNNGQTPPTPWNAVSFTVEDVELGSPGQAPGFRGKLLRDSAGTLYYTYLRAGPNVPECSIAISPSENMPSIAYDLIVAVKPASASAFTLEQVPLGSLPDPSTEYPTEDFISNPLGIDAALDESNRLVIAAPAGGSGLFVCASSDLVIATRNGPDDYALSAPVTSSGACCDTDPINDANEANDDLELCPNDAACRSGTDVGAWPALAVRTDGTLAVAFTDTHNTTDNDGQTHQGFELYTGAGVSGIRPWSNNGQWAQLREINGKLMTAFSSYEGKGAKVLIQDGENWNGIDQSFGATVGERLQLEVAPNGTTIGLVYYAINDKDDQKVEDLYLCESADEAITFSCSRPESATLVAGANPSLAYDSKSRPILSYYYCGSADCTNDGLRVAWRDSDGKWWKFNVANIAQNRAGFYSSVVVDPTTGEPTIVFQDITRGAAMVAYGKFD